MNAKIKRFYNKKACKIAFILHQIDYIETQIVYHYTKYSDTELRVLESQLKYLKALEKSYSLYLTQF